MNHLTRNLKQAAQRSNTPLRTYAKEAATDKDHPYHANALAWIEHKTTLEQFVAEQRKETRDKNRSYRAAHPRKKGKKDKKSDGKKEENKMIIKEES